MTGPRPGCGALVAGRLSRGSVVCFRRGSGDQRSGLVTAAADAPAHERDEAVFIEPRWPIALVLAAYIAMTITLRVTVPDRPRLGPEWLVPALEILCLVALVLADPSHISARARWLRRVG